MRLGQIPTGLTCLEIRGKKQETRWRKLTVASFLVAAAFLQCMRKTAAASMTSAKVDESANHLRHPNVLRNEPECRKNTREREYECQTKATTRQQLTVGLIRRLRKPDGCYEQHHAVSKSPPI
jgi:hypothetical protein